MMTIGVQGASGRTGGLLLSTLPEFSNCNLGAAIVSSASSFLGKTAIEPVEFSADVAASVSKCDIWIDFSSPESAVKLAGLCAKHKKPLLVATTGLSPEQLAEIKEAAKECAILLAPNTSFGIFALRAISQSAQSILGEGYDIEVSEIHHRMKKDSPSGTALHLADALRGKDTPLTFDRSPHKKVRADDIGVTAIRGGDVVGEHTVYFIGNGERLELTHRVWDRKIFARGAITLAFRLFGKAPGLYGLDRAFLENG